LRLRSNSTARSKSHRDWPVRAVKRPDRARLYQMLASMAIEFRCDAPGKCVAPILGKSFYAIILPISRNTATASSGSIGGSLPTA
jgi:hypothetical protein